MAVASFWYISRVEHSLLKEEEKELLEILFNSNLIVFSYQRLYCILEPDTKGRVDRTNLIVLFYCSFLLIPKEYQVLDKDIFF